MKKIVQISNSVWNIAMTLFIKGFVLVKIQQFNIKASGNTGILNDNLTIVRFP